MSQSTAQQQRELIERHYKIMTQYQLNKELDILEMLQKSSLLKEVRETVDLYFLSRGIGDKRLEIRDDLLELLKNMEDERQH